MSKFDLALKHLITGEPFTLGEVAKLVGSAPAYVSSIKTAAIELGYRFRVEGNTHRCTNPEHEPERTVGDVLREQSRRRRQHQKESRNALAGLQQKRKAASNQMKAAGHTIEAMRSPGGVLGMDTPGTLDRIPAMGDQLEVFAMIRRDDGSLRLGLLGSDGGRWLVDIVGEFRG